MVYHAQTHASVPQHPLPLIIPPKVPTAAAWVVNAQRLSDSRRSIRADGQSGSHGVFACESNPACAMDRLTCRRWVWWQSADPPASSHGPSDWAPRAMPKGLPILEVGRPDRHVLENDQTAARDWPSRASTAGRQPGGPRYRSASGRYPSEKLQLIFGQPPGPVCQRRVFLFPSRVVSSSVSPCLRPLATTPAARRCVVLKPLQQQLLQLSRQRVRGRRGSVPPTSRACLRLLILET